MGINLSHYVKDVNQLFTLEEAERLFIAAGYTKKDQSIVGFEEVKISPEILKKNNRVDSSNNIGDSSDFKMRVKHTQKKHTSLENADIVGMEKIVISLAKRNVLGGAA